MTTIMARSEFNLSVLENATTFSTPLKDCSQYEAIFSLIKEEIDIAHTEDEAEYHKCGNRSVMATKRKDSESNDSEGVFKSPYKKNVVRKSKSPGTNLIPRTQRRSLENVKTRVKNYAPQRARSLGRIMSGRSRQSTYRKHRSSISHSETSGFSDCVENEKIANVENVKPSNIFTKKVKKENETEGQALEDLLITAREQVIVNGQPSDGNSTVSSQGESSSLATTDPLAIESMEEDYVESSQNVQISDIRLKLLAQETSANAKPKTAEMIKKNLHFDATESDDENQDFSLTLSPDPKTLVNSNQVSNSTSPHQINGKESPVSGLSTVSTLKNVSQNLRNLDTKSEASVEALRSTKRRTSQDSDMSTLKNSSQNLQKLTPNSCDSHRQKELNESPLRSNEIKGTELSVFSSKKNVTKIGQNCDHNKEASSASPRFDEKNMTHNNIASTLKNPPLILANTPHQRKSSKVEETKTVNAKESSIENLELKSEVSETPPRQKKRKRNGLKTTSSQESLTEESSSLDSQKKEILRPSRPRKRKSSRESTGSSQTNLTKDLEPKKEGSATPPYPRKRKSKGIKAASSQESLIEESKNLESGNKEVLTSPCSRKRKTSQEDTASTQTNLVQDLEPKEETNATPVRPKKRKSKVINTANFQKNLTEESSNLKFKKERSLTPPHPRKRKKEEINIDSSVKETNDNSTALESETEVNAAVQSRKNKKSKEIVSNSMVKRTDLDSKDEISASSTLLMTNIPRQAIVPSSPKDSSVSSPKKEPSATPPHPKKKKKIHEIISELLQDVTGLDFNAEASMKRSHSRKKKGIQEVVSTSVPESNELSPKKEASLTPPPCRKKKKRTDHGQHQEIVSDLVENSAETICNKEKSTRLSRPRKKTINHSIVSISAADSTDLSPKKEACLTPPRPQKLNSSIVSPLKGLTQEFEDCIMNNDFEQMCEDIDNNMETPSFTFETVQLLDEYDARNQHANNMILSKILSSPNSKTDEEPPLSIEHVGSSEDLLDYDPLYIAKVEATIPAIASTSKKKKSVGAKIKEDKRKSNTADTSENERRRSSTRLKEKPVTMNASDHEDCNDLSDEAMKLAKQIEVAKKKEGLSPETLIKLDEIVVQLRHEVLPQHDIEQRAGTTPLTYRQQLEFLEYASLNKDTYSNDEDDIIKKNWRAFCEDHDWDPKDFKPFLHFKHGDQLIMSSLEERRKFVQFLAHGLPNRPLFSVYSRFKILYSNYPDGGMRYTPEEDKKILAYMQHNSEKEPAAKCSALSKVLKRSRVSIWRRYKNLTAKENRNKKKKILMKVTWELPLVTEFIRKLLDVSVSDDLAELKDAFIPKVVWKRLERKIGIDYEFLRRSWDQQFHLQFFSPEPLSLNATKIRLIEYMWMKGIRHSKEIEWHTVVKYFDGCTIPFLRRMFNHLTAHSSSAVGSRNLHEILKWLHTTKIDQLRLDPKDKLLPRLCYVNKKVDIVPEDFMILTMKSDNDPD